MDQHVYDWAAESLQLAAQIQREIDQAAEDELPWLDDDFED